MTTFAYHSIFYLFYDYNYPWRGVMEGPNFYPTFLPSAHIKHNEVEKNHRKSVYSSPYLKTRLEAPSSLVGSSGSSLRSMVGGGRLYEVLSRGCRGWRSQTAGLYYEMGGCGPGLSRRGRLKELLRGRFLGIISLGHFFDEFCQK